MTKSFIKDILSIITRVPGLIGITNIDPKKLPVILPEEQWENGINIIGEDTKEILMSIAIIVSTDINAKIIVKEIMSSLKDFLFKNNIKSSNVSIVIKGVK